MASPYLAFAALIDSRSGEIACYPDSSIASSSADNLTAIEKCIRDLGGTDLFLSRGSPREHISALTARSPRAVLLAPSSASEAFQYLLLKRSITGKARSIPTLVVVKPEEKEEYHSLVSVGEFELLSVSLPDEAFTEILVRTLRYFDSHLELAKQASLRDSQLELKGVINTLTDGVIVTNVEGVIQRTTRHVQLARTPATRHRQPTF